MADYCLDSKTPIGIAFAAFELQSKTTITMIHVDRFNADLLLQMNCIEAPAITRIIATPISLVVRRAG